LAWSKIEELCAGRLSPDRRLDALIASRLSGDASRRHFSRDYLCKFGGRPQRGAIELAEFKCAISFHDESHAWAGWRAGLTFRRLSLGNASMVFDAC
jgi:hypothetical protein